MTGLIDRHLEADTPCFRVSDIDKATDLEIVDRGVELTMRIERDRQ